MQQHHRAALSSLLVCAYGLAATWHTTYYHVNIIVYVVGFVGAIGSNMLALWLLRKSWGKWPAVSLMALHLLVMASVAMSWPYVTTLLV